MKVKNHIIMLPLFQPNYTGLQKQHYFLIVREVSIAII